jgi:lambda repressor-like predicted transcriptional regulator
MTPSEIKVALERRKTSLANLSRELGVANSSVTNVVYQRMHSARIESAIAEVLEIPLHEVFPERYPKPADYQEPLMVEISTIELAQIRQSLARATQAIDRLCTA